MVAFGQYLYPLTSRMQSFICNTYMASGRVTPKAIAITTKKIKHRIHHVFYVNDDY